MRRLFMSGICRANLLNATRPSRDHPERHAHVRVILLRAPDVNQRSVCGGKSGGIGRFNERGAVSLCDPIAERSDKRDANIRQTFSFFQIFPTNFCQISLFATSAEHPPSITTPHDGKIAKLHIRVALSHSKTDHYNNILYYI